MLTLPGASYLAGLSRIDEQNYSTPETVLVVIGFNLIMLARARTLALRSRMCQPHRQTPGMGGRFAASLEPKTPAWPVRQSRRQDGGGAGGGGAGGGGGGDWPGLGGPDFFFRCRRRIATNAPTRPAAIAAPISTHAQPGRPPDSEELFPFAAAAAAAAAAPA
jgi:hypothetical protein